MLSLADIARAQSDIEGHSLSMPAIYHTLSPAGLQQVANGIGPDSVPSFVRSLITDAFERFLGPSVGHDIRYTWALGTEADWHDANRQFRDNCERMLSQGTSWWQVLKRRELRKEADFLYRMVESDAGRGAYMAAYRKGPPNLAGEG